MKLVASCPAAPSIVRALIALGFAVGLLATSIPARADDSSPHATSSTALGASTGSERTESLGDRLDGHWPTAKRVTTFTFFGISAVSLGYAVFSFVELERARSEHDSDFPHLGSTSIVDCTTPDQCAKLRANRDEQNRWSTSVIAAASVAGVAARGAALVAVLWPNGTTRVAPSASSDGASLTMVGRF